MTFATSACVGQPPLSPSPPGVSPTSAPVVGSPVPPTATTDPMESIPADSPAPGTAAVRDDSLLAVFPPELGGVPVTAEDASFEEAAADPAFAANVARAAFAVVASPTDLASGVVAEPVPGALDDDFFRDWRETYDEGACAQAGGVATNAETALGGRTVHVTTCAEGITVYHALLEERGLIVSLFSLGEGRYGEQLMRDLRP